MTVQSRTILVVEGTVRDGRNSIYPARYVTAQFQEKDHDAEPYGITDYDIPLFTNRRDMTGNPHLSGDIFGQKVEAADAILS
nr:NAD(P)H-dependent oxidoreductase [Natronococcus sp. AD5]